MNYLAGVASWLQSRHLSPLKVVYVVFACVRKQEIWPVLAEQMRGNHSV